MVGRRWLSHMRRPRSGVAASERDVLLATKLHVPRPQPGFVARPRLAEALDEGLARGLVLVCAPAGFGKTALLADWVRSGDRPVAWLSLDAADNDPVRFWRHVVAALDRARPGIGERVGPLLGPPAPPSFEGLVTALINELAAQPGEDEVLLVLDDYHLIDAQQVHASLEFLLEHLPPGLHLVLASRSDPPLPLARLRAGGQLAELRAAELRFTAEEAAALLREAAGRRPARRRGGGAGGPHRRVGGRACSWPPCRCAGRPIAAGFVAAFSGSHRYVLDYLAEEVLDRQPEEVRAFLLETSVLERLSRRAVRCGHRPGLTARRCWSRWSGRTCSWCRWMRCAAGGATTTCSPTCSAPACSSNSPIGSRHCTATLPPGHEEHGLADDAVRHAVAAGEMTWAARLIEQHFDASPPAQRGGDGAAVACGAAR